ncbi:CACNA2D4 (predicted) [Pycnogonum litorale]
MSSETRCSDKHWFGRAATERTPKSRSMMLRFCSYFRHSTTRSTLFSMFIIAFIIITYHIQILSCVQVDNDRSISPIQVKNWATSFGAEIYLACSQLSNLEDIKRNLHKESPKINIRHPESILREMKRDVEYFLKSKIHAVQRIAAEAEIRSKRHEFKKGLKFDYNNSKKIVPIYTKNEYGYNEDENEEESSSAEQPEVPEGHVVMRLTKNKHFRNIPVNTKTTTVHVPVNVYDKADNVINAIKWSADLQQNFVDNYERDPSLTWQYFASSTGFMRHHPGLMWKDNNPDLFDSRLRNWYINAAASPKDVVILLANSGSMAGLRKEIAKHVVRSLLDTLSDNDYVSVMNFSKTTNPLVPCFGEELVQANMENVRAFKSHLNNIETHVIANFNGSLTKAFHILSKSIKRRGYTSGCNQAIMVITDGAPYTYEEVFRRYNWPNATVRIFTYLIGREVTERREVNWMACANRGDII